MGLGELDGRHADATGSAMHQQRLTGLQAGPFKDVRPHGEAGLRAGWPLRAMTIRPATAGKPLGWATQYSA